jgi:hypothetical protein
MAWSLKPINPINKIMGRTLVKDRRSKNNEDDTYPRIEFDSWSNTFFLAETSNPEQDKQISEKKAKQLAKTKKYYFQEYGQRGGSVDKSKLYKPEEAEKEVEGWSGYSD